MAVWEYSMYGQLTTKITAAVLATVIVVALLVPVVMSVSTEYTSAYNSGQRYSTDIDGEHQIGIAKNGVSYEITTDGNANPSPTFIDTSVDPNPQQNVQPTPSPSRSPLRGEPVRAVPAQNNNADYAYLMTYNTTTSQITGVYKDGNIATKTNPETGVHQGQSGSWTWSSTTGLGPFNMYYQAVNTVDHTAYSDVENGKIGHVAYVLDPADLTKVIIGGQSTTSANFSSHLSEYNVMLVIPTVYWYSDGAGNLYISNTDSNSYIPSQVNAKMNAYAHTVNGTMSGDKITGGDVYEYIMIGVYEAYSDPTLGMTSQSGVTPTASKTISGFRSDVATANARITDGQGTYVQWNYYQYTLYKILAQAQMGNKDSQQTIGQGNMGGSAQSTTGLGNASGPYANTDNSYSKLFIENSWGSLREFVDNTYCSERIVKAGSGLSPVSGSSSFTIDGTDYTGGSTSLPSQNGWITESYEGSATWDIPKTSSSTAGSYQTNDYVYSNTGKCVLLVGGNWSDGARAGLSFWSSYSALSYSATNIGSRLAYYAAGDAPATVTITVNDPTYGTVDVQSLSVPVGTAVSASGNVLTVGTTPITATPAQATAQYTYAFGSWGNVPSGGTITSDVTITANFTRTVNSYNVTVQSNNTSYGTVSQSTVTVPYGTSISASSNILTVGSVNVTATPNTATAQYTYAFANWSNVPAGGIVTSDVTVTANFTATTNTYTVSIVSNNTSYGTVSQSSLTVPYGTAMSISSNILTVGGTNVTATPASATAQYTYSFNNWSGAQTTVTGDMTITANFTATVNQYTVQIVSNNTDYGTVDTASVTVDYGTSISAVQNVLTVGSNTVTATPAQATAQYTYSFGSWTGTAQTVTGDMTVTANFTRSVNDYTVTITVNDSTYGSVDTASVTVPYGTSISTSANVLTIGSNTVTQTPATATQQYTYSFGSWTGTAQTVTADMNVTANFTRVTNDYTVTITVNDPAYGTVDTASVTVPYGTAMGTSQNVLTIGSNTVTQTPATATAQYTYSFDSWTGTTATVTDDMAVTANFTRATNDYTVTVAVNDANYGSVDVSSVTVPYGTAVSTADNVLTIGSTDVTQTPASPTQQYRYAFDSWTGAPQTVTSDVTITAVFTQSPRDYIVTVTVNDPAYGTVDVQTVTVDYGATISAASNVLTVGSTDVTATANQPTAQYTFAFSSWSGVPAGGTVTDDITVTAVFTATVNEYHVHIQVNDARQGSVDISDLNVPYGTTMTTNGNVLTINTSPATVVTASVNAPTAQYTFQFTDWVNVGTVTGDVNVVARYTVITNEYTVTFAVNDSNYGYVTEQSITALYGTSVTVDGNSVSVGPYDSTATPASATAQYTYAFDSWTGAPQTVTGDVTITANFSRTVNQYAVQIVSNNTDYGTVDISSVTVDYGTSVTVSSNVLTVGSNTITATPATSTPQWTYVFTEWQNVPLAVTGDVTVTAVFTATHLVYTVTFVTNGGTPVTAQEVEQGQTATRPADPYLFSYYLVNWYSDDALTTAYNFATPVTGDTIVYQGYAPDRYSLVAYGSDGLVVLFDRSGALVYVGGGDGNVRLATITQGSSYNLVLTDGEFTAGEETATVTGFVHPRGNLAYGQNQWMNADSPFGVFGVLNTTTSGGADIGFSYAVTGIFGNHEDVVVEQSYGDKINSIACAQEIVDARVSGATVSIVTEDSDSASYTDAYILAPYEIRTYNPDYVGDTLATLLMAIAVFCVLGIIAMVGYNRVKG